MRQIEALIYKKPRRRGKTGTRADRVVPPHIAAIERHLSEHLGTRVMVEEGTSKGRIIIEFYSNEDFERILGAIGAQ